MHVLYRVGANTLFKLYPKVKFLMLRPTRETGGLRLQQGRQTPIAPGA